MKRLSSEEFYKQLQESEKGREYYELVQQILSENRSPRKYNDGFELHHIQPRALGGKVKLKSNLLKVTCFEHCKLHVLLAKAIQCFETLRPVIMMSGQQYLNCSDLEKVTLEDIYEWSKLREEAKKLKYSEETRRKISEGNKGKRYSEEVRKKMSELAKGKNTWSRGLVWINNGQSCKRVHVENLNQFLLEGWTKGELSQSEEIRKKKSKISKGLNTWSKGRVRINRGEETKVVLKEDLEKYLQEGWQQGWSAAARTKISKSSIGKKGAVSGRVRIHKGETVKLVPKESLDDLLKEGWVLGTSESYRVKNSKGHLNRVWINDGQSEKLIPEREVKKYLSQGWKPKRLYHKKDIN